MKTAGLTATTHTGYADDESIWRLVANYVSEASVAMRFAPGVCPVLSGFGWAMIIAALTWGILD